MNNHPSSDKDNLEGSWPPPEPVSRATDRASENATQELSVEKMMRIAENLRRLRVTTHVFELYMSSQVNSHFKCVDKYSVIQASLLCVELISC